MIQEFVDRFISQQEAVKDHFRAGHPESYLDIVKKVIDIVGQKEYDQPDSDRITLIDDGDYQGTLVFVIAENGYQPDDYWYVKVNYGSCSGCDTLQAISDYSDNPPTEDQVNEYYTLALHIVQGMKKMD